MVSGNFANRVRQVISRRDNSGLEIIAEDVAGATQAYRVSQDDDIFTVLNDALDTAGQDGLVTVENGRYLKSNGNPVSTQVTSKAEGQEIDFQGSDVELADNSGISSMINIQHDSFIIRRSNFLGNRNNNSSLNAVVDNSGSILEPTINDIEISGAPDGILLDSADECQITNSGTVSGNQDVDRAIKLTNCSDSNVVNAKVAGFNNDGIRLENSDSINISALGIVPESDLGASHGVHMLGSRNCSIRGVISADGELDKGVRDEGFDVGGDNERFSTGNIFDLIVNGVNDIGFHISDAEKERIRGLVDGSKPTGRTTQAFLVDSPNGLANPQHDINLSGVELTRITDTDETGTNVGISFEGHYSQIQNSSVVGLGGDSVVNPRFGQSTASPTLETKSGTDVVHHVHTKKDNTDNNGQVTLDWSDHYAFGDKPMITTSIEQSGETFITTWNTNGNGRYTDAVIQVTDSGGTAVGKGVTVVSRLIGV